MNWKKECSIRAGLLLVTVATTASLWADVKSNPYESIVDRNPFGLRPPPPPPSNEPPPPPAAPLATVELTGITSLFHKDRALLEIMPGPGKPMLKPILSVGERVESIEVVSINVEKNEVVIKNGNTVTNLGLKVAKAGGAPPQPGMVPPPPGINPAFQPPPQAFPPNNAFQNNTSRGGAVTYGAGGAVGAGGNSGMSTFGATPAAATSFGGGGGGGGGQPAYGGYGAPAIGQPGGAVGAVDGLRGIPSRTVRAQTQEGHGQPVDPAVQYINMRVQELEHKKAGRPFPPLPPILGLEE